MLGTWARFKGLGTAPFAVDEYYLSQSIGDVLRTGLPAFDCGGFYVRGILLQYVVAGLQLAGLGPEFAPRLICAVASIIGLPAAWWLGMRLQGRTLASLVVIILSLSLWEVELARFGRMYAPFQALFLWYLVQFVRYTVQRDTRALWPMLLLSAAGPLVWEGGVFLPLVNVLVVVLQDPSGLLRRNRWGYVAGCLALLVAAVAFVTFDFRTMTGDAFPAGLDDPRAGVPRPEAALGDPLAYLSGHPWLIGLALVPLALAALALPFVWRRRQRPLLALGLLLMLVAALAHRFLLVGALALLLPLIGFIGWRELWGREARGFWLAIGTALLLWVLVTGLALHAAPAAATGLHGLLQAVDPLFGFPDAIGVVLLPFARTLPVLGLALLVLLALTTLRMARSTQPLDSERALLVIFVVLLLASSASDPPRQETRYVYFLYPVALLLALKTLLDLAALLAPRASAAPGIAAGVALLGFTATEDFNFDHLRRIDDPVHLYRLGMPVSDQTHFVIRDDLRGIAQWLRAEVPANAVVINTVHGLDRYYDGFRYFFVEARTPEFFDWSCRRGAVERWGNTPLLYSGDALKAAIGPGGSAWIVSFDYDEATVLRQLADLHPRIVTSRGGVIVIELRG